MGFATRSLIYATLWGTSYQQITLNAGLIYYDGDKILSDQDAADPNSIVGIMIEVMFAGGVIPSHRYFLHRNKTWYEAYMVEGQLSCSWQTPLDASTPEYSFLDMCAGYYFKMIEKL